MRPALRRGRHHDHRAAERNRHRHLLRERPDRRRYRHRDGYRGLGHHEDDQKKVRDHPSERNSPVRASFPGSDAGRRRKVRHCAADEAHPDVLPEHHRDVRDVHPVRHVRDGFHRDHPGCHRDGAYPGWMRRGCFRGGGHRGEALQDEVHPAWVLRRQRDGVREVHPAWELHPAWEQLREYRLQDEQLAWEREFPSRFQLLHPSGPQP